MAHYAGYALIAGNALDLTDLYMEVVQGEGLEAVIVHDPNEARRVVSERGTPKLVIADLEVARDSSFKLLREVQDSIAPDDRPAVLASVSRELRTTAGDLTEALGIAEVLPRGADARTIGSAVRRALSKSPSAAPPSSARATPSQREQQVRLARITAMGLLDDARRDKELEELVAQIAEGFAVPIALVSVTLDDGRWFKAHIALSGGAGESRSAARDSSFCAHVAESGQLMFVADATVHPVFSTHPLVRRGLVGTCAGAPLTTSDGEVLGALCILDTKPGTIDPNRVDMLARLARRVAWDLELRSKARSSALEVIRLTEKLAEERERHRSSKSRSSQLEAVFAAMDVGVFAMNHRRRIGYANRAALDLLGLPLERVVGEELSPVCERLFVDPRDFRIAVSSALQASVASSRDLSADKPSKRPLRWSFMPIELADGIGHLCTVFELERAARGRYGADARLQPTVRPPKRKR